MKHQNNCIVSRSKFLRQDVTVNGVTFKNKALATKYYDLLMLEEMNVVECITREPQFVVDGHAHVADFVYFHKELGKMIAEFVRKNKTKKLLSAIEALSNAYKNVEFRVVT